MPSLAQVEEYPKVGDVLSKVAELVTRYLFGRLPSSQYPGVLGFGNSCRNIFREIIYVKIISKNHNLIEIYNKVRYM